MKILFAIKSLSVEGGGAERILVNIASSLARRGHHVSILSFDPTGSNTFYRLDQEVKRVFIPVGSLNAPANLSATLKRIFSLRKTIKSLAPDIVVGFMHSMFVPLGLALVGSKIPVIASEHTVLKHYQKRPLEGLLLLLTPLFVRNITVVSEQVLEGYPSMLRKYMVVIPNPICVIPEKRADTAGSGLTCKTLLTVGHLAPHKDHITLIEAFARIADRLPDWNLRIIGEGECRKILESRINDLGLSRRIFMPGTTTDILQEYSNAQLFVIPSRYESFSLVTAEALAHGLPVVGFEDCAGINQLVRHNENGLLVNGSENRINSLAEAIECLLSDKLLRTRLAANSKTPHHLKLDQVVIHWEKLLCDEAGAHN